MLRDHWSWPTERSSALPTIVDWSEKAQLATYSFDVEHAGPLSENAQVTRILLGPVAIANLRYPALELKRTSQHVSNTNGRMFSLLYINSGSQRCLHCGDEVVLSSGQCVLGDMGETSNVEVSEGECTILVMPEMWLKGIFPEPHLKVGRIISAENPWAKALGACLTAAHTIEATDEHSSDRIAEAIATTLSLAFTDVNNDKDSSFYRHHLLLRIRQTIASRSQEYDLSLSSVAAEHRISTRYLQMVFASAGSTFSDELWNIRLRRSAKLLRDEQFSDTSVAEIAWRCGFADPSHFARRFRQKFGVPPGQFRTNNDNALDVTDFSYRGGHEGSLQ